MFSSSFIASHYRRAGRGGVWPGFGGSYTRWPGRSEKSGLGMAGRDTLTIVGDGTASMHDLLEFSSSAVETDLDGEQAHSQEVRDLGRGEPMRLAQ